LSGQNAQSAGHGQRWSADTGGRTHRYGIDGRNAVAAKKAPRNICEHPDKIGEACVLREDYRHRVMKNQIVEKITALWGQGKAVKEVTRPTRMAGSLFRAVLLGADKRTLESVDFEAYDSSIASILWMQACEVVAAAT